MKNGERRLRVEGEEVAESPLSCPSPLSPLAPPSGLSPLRQAGRKSH